MVITASMDLKGNKMLERKDLKNATTVRCYDILESNYSQIISLQF